MKRPDPRDIPTLDDLVFPGEHGVSDLDLAPLDTAEFESTEETAREKSPLVSLPVEPIIGSTAQLRPSGDKFTFASAPYLHDPNHEETPDAATSLPEDLSADNGAPSAFDPYDWHRDPYIASVNSRTGLDDDPRDDDEPRFPVFGKLDSEHTDESDEPKLYVEGRQGQLADYDDSEHDFNLDVTPAPDPVEQQTQEKSEAADQPAEDAWPLFDFDVSTVPSPTIQTTEDAPAEDAYASLEIDVAESALPPTPIDTITPNEPVPPQNMANSSETTDLNARIEMALTRALSAEWPDFQQRIVAAVLRELESGSD